MQWKVVRVLGRGVDNIQGGKEREESVERTKIGEEIIGEYYCTLYNLEV